MNRALTLLALLCSSAALADEGMWLLNNFPADKVAQKYNFKPTQEWLDKVRLSAVRIAGGCSASFVSPSGLVMTNHHCVRRCVQELSTPKRDYAASGFHAKSEKEELRCPNFEINQLVEITDVTAAMNTATAGLDGAKFNEALKAEMSRTEKACATSDALRCDVVTLYHGGAYHLYKYRRFQDVRLAFAPEHAIAFFGGDPDNFNFPRYDLDLAFLRVYEADKPAKTDHYFKWNPSGAKEGELTFIFGNPGKTSRTNTIAELTFQRDVALPLRLIQLSEVRGMLTEFQRKGPEQKRISEASLFGVENSIKALRGRHAALVDKKLFAMKVKEEQDLKAKLFADPKKKALYGPAWDNIDKAVVELAAIRKPLVYIEQGSGFWSDYFGIARKLVRAAEELPKANETRLREYGDAQLPALKNSLFSKAPIYDEFEILTLSHSLTKLREELGADDPFVKQLFGKQSPNEVAARLVKGTKLRDLKVREQLFAGGKQAVDASKDPMIEFARLVDPASRAVRKKYEDEIESVFKKSSELIAKARFDAYGTSIYPDATFTMRISYGAVKGWSENGKTIPPFTHFAGAFERHTGRDPFALPKSWLDKQKALTPTTPFNMATTNDIIGGNSGSPVINKDAEIVGLVFDGNIHSLGGEYGYDETMNRAVSVHSAGMTEALEKIYNATRLVNELKGTPVSSPAGSR